MKDLAKDFQEKHMLYLHQSLVFEYLVEGHSREGLAVMQYHINKDLETFRSD